MKQTILFLAVLLGAATAWGQESDPIATGLGGVATVIGESRTTVDSVSVVNGEGVTANGEGTKVEAEKPLWKQKLYYGYNFDIYFHHDSRADKKENGWSIAITPEIGWKLKERVYLGMRFGGAYANTYMTSTILHTDGTKTTEDLRIMHGSWEVAPYTRYRMKTMFNGKLGIWLEAHLYTGMDFPRVMDGTITGSDYDGMRYSLTYGFQISPVITYQFNKKSTFQVFFSILSLGYSGTTRFYDATSPYGVHNEYTNDVIIFSGKLSNLIANQFTPGLYGLRFGVQKSF